MLFISISKITGNLTSMICRSLTMIVKLLSENTDTYQAIQSLVSLVCESTSEKGQSAIREKVSNSEIDQSVIRVGICIVSCISHIKKPCTGA